MTNHKLLIEAILFAAGKPLTLKKISALLEIEEATAREIIDELSANYTSKQSGIQIFESAEGIQMGTSPEAATVIAAMTKDETTGELTKAQLETLSIIAYRGPITKGTLEEIRGVNCGMILRNLLIRGLIVEATDTERPGEKKFAVSQELVGYLGITRVNELPDYASLSTHEALEVFLKSKELPKTTPNPEPTAS